MVAEDSSSARYAALGSINPFDADSDEDNGQIFDLSKSLLSEYGEDEDQLFFALLSKKNEDANRLPNMWSRDFIGLYAQYAIVGLMYGSSGTLVPFCTYVFDGRSNVCANSGNVVFFAWSLKIFYAVLTDSVHPAGLRRKPWMILGMTGVLFLLLLLTLFSHKMNVTMWLSSLLTIQVFLMFSDVPADGYSVELGRLESPEQRGQILATGQRIRFTFCIVAGIIQTFFLNGKSTNSSGCAISLNHCWTWGLTINQYYGVLLVLTAVLFIPITFLKELEGKSQSHQEGIEKFVAHMWITLQNLTTLYLLIYGIGIGILSNFPNNTNTFLQYDVIKLSSFQSGIDTITSYISVVVAMYIFQTILINRSWRMTQYLSTTFSNIFGLLWILAYYNVGGLRNPWFTIFIDLDQSFANGLSQVLVSLAVIELASEGQEATTYELVMTALNAASSVSSIFATQLLVPMGAVGCTKPSVHADTHSACPADTVDITSAANFEATHGPWRFTRYALLLFVLSTLGCVAFTPYLPASREECHRWKVLGQSPGSAGQIRGAFALTISAVTVLYGIVSAILLLDPATSCLKIVGGSGC